ncbi:MAG: TetR/AcrR family transcriptional regulator [Leptospiraceae bacterium]|nr:TetR/AcrR family transcriptional regulator [Leptospiraceae bacterium]
MGEPRTKIKLLKAAETLCSQKGFHRIQVSDITKEAGLSTGSFYIYFKDKDAIFYEVLDNSFKEYMERWKEFKKGRNNFDSAQYLRIIHQIFEFTFQYYLDRPGIFLMSYRHGYGVSREIDDLITTFTSNLEKTISEDIQEANLIQVADPKTVSQCLIGMVMFVTHSMITTGKPTLESAVENCTQLASAGLISYSMAGGYENLLKFAEFLKSIRLPIFNPETNLSTD